MSESFPLILKIEGILLPASGMGVVDPCWLEGRGATYAKLCLLLGDGLSVVRGTQDPLDPKKYVVITLNSLFGPVT